MKIDWVKTDWDNKDNVKIDDFWLKKQKKCELIEIEAIYRFY